MGNSYFQFKQFTINQEISPMKVCTDACIFGAIIQYDSPKSILDIGTGTGLLAIMLAQRYDAPIDAVEINPNCIQEARSNVIASPWSKQINIIAERVQDFATAVNHQYDLIISNPPFYPNHLKSGDQEKNLALHNDALSFHELAFGLHKLLSAKGSAFIMYPATQAEEFIKTAKKVDLFPSRKINIFDKNDSKILRVIIEFSKTHSETTESHFVIKNDQGRYTDAFVQLLKPYYLSIK